MHRVAKHKSCLPEIRRYVEHDERYFTPEERSELKKFFGHVDKIIIIVNVAQATKNPALHKCLWAFTRTYWKDHNLLPKHPNAEDRPTLLDKVDAWIDGSA